MYLLSRLHRYAGIGRFGSLVTRCALSNGSAAFFTQTFRVSFHGLRNAMYCPSGEICAPAISGLPKKSSLSLSGGCAASALAGSDTRPSRHTKNSRRVDLVTGFLEGRSRVPDTMPENPTPCPDQFLVPAAAALPSVSS